MPVRRPLLADASTYRGLLYLVSAVPLGMVWFSVLVCAWTASASVAFTPLIVPALLAMAALTRGMAAVESALARSLLSADARAPRGAGDAAGFWGRFRARLGPGFWRAQAFLTLRWLIGFPLGVAFVALLASELGAIFAPVWVPYAHEGAQLGFWHPHTATQALPLVPIGLLLLPLTVLAARPFASLFGWSAGTLLPADPRQSALPLGLLSGRWLARHAAGAFAVWSLALLLWAFTSSYFWPEWAIVPSAGLLAIHAWLVAVVARSGPPRRLADNSALAITAGIGAVIACFLVIVWAITSRDVFWPVWPIGALVLLIASHGVVNARGSSVLTARIATLETTRAGAVDVQDTELRRIERDLHDGAQARLVALGMSLGMAEQQLDDDPERARALLVEARAGAETALRELRDLARGIHPPVLADRGLEAALNSLANATPMQVTLDVSVGERPPPAVETAAYFVAAEALANAAKHARAEHVDVTLERRGAVLSLAVRDDGCGGAEPAGHGLSGLRRRVEALDGRLSISSPPGGPTVIGAELPCA
jgi:signal transduction histidine kinase